jgi:hypothetical protein
MPGPLRFPLPLTAREVIPWTEFTAQAKFRRQKLRTQSRSEATVCLYLKNYAACC